MIILFSILIAGVLLSCGRREAPPWFPAKDSPSLLEGMNPTTPDGGAVPLRRTFRTGSAAHLDLDLSYEVLLRGHLLSTLRVELIQGLSASERVVRDDASGLSVLGLTVSEATVSLDPAVEGAEDQRQQSLAGLSWERTVDADNRFHRNRDGQTTRAGPAGEVDDGLDRLEAVLPDVPVSVGMNWPFERVVERPIQGGGSLRTRLSGSYRFLGMVPDGGRTLAAIEAEYEVRVDGPETDGEAVARIREATGFGRGAFLVNPTNGATYRSEVIESVHLVLDIREGHEDLGAEQLSTLRLRLTRKEPAI
jgi:hypothetical protein